ncbi:MAG: sulfatase [Phycisphaerae bacterium]|nr:sulfatase [Phycisphaerae bacterium]MDW8263022.1 sulfatase [Phycisphaerales bacterium]
MRIAVFLALLCVLPAWAYGQGAATPARPNVIVILTDDHASHAISAYGSRLMPTPNIDRIAREGVRFENSFVTNSLCGPSRATLLTGKYAHKHGYRDQRPGRSFDPSQLTFPILLQRAGYETAVFGKWHLRSEPRGFDKWLIIEGVARYFSPRFRDSAGVRVIEGYATDTIFEKAIEFIRNRNQSRPFFLLITPNAPHRNWTVDAAHQSLLEGVEIPEPPTFLDDLSTRTTAARQCRMSIEHDLTKNDLKGDPPPGLSGAALKKWKYQRFIKDYLRCVAAVDVQVGRLLEQLRTSGLEHNTLLIYSSDNGFFLGDHGWFDKRFMYEQSLRVPLLARLPGVIPAGLVCQAMVLNIDTAPTILSFCGIPVPAEMQGQSWKPLVEKAGGTDILPSVRGSIYYHYYEQEPEHNVAPHRGVRTETHKLIHFYTHDEWELYDLTKDPDELRNVYDHPAYAVTRNRLKAELQRLRKHYGDDRED